VGDHGFQNYLLDPQIYIGENRILECVLYIVDDYEFMSFLFSGKLLLKKIAKNSVFNSAISSQRQTA